MKLNMKAAVFAAVPLLLTACAGTQLGETRGLPQSGNAFDQALYAGYLDRSQHEYGYGNYSSSDAFALKAQAAAAGNPVEPFTANDKGAHPPGLIPDSDLPAMVSGREKLVAAFGNGAKQRLPADAATAQVNYDCWIEEQSYIGDFAEADQPIHAQQCRDAFEKALAAISVVTPEPAVLPGNIVVFFDWDSSALTTAAQNLIREAARIFDRGDMSAVETVGHADKSGTVAYNNELSAERSASVASELSRLGVPTDDIDVTWRGEADPLVPTADGVREPQNRRVEILFEK